MIDACLLAGQHVDGCIYTGGTMTKETTVQAKSKDKDKKPRHPSAGALLKSLNEYMGREDIGVDASIGTVINKLEQTIVAEDQAKR